LDDGSNTAPVVRLCVSDDVAEKCHQGAGRRRLAPTIPADFRVESGLSARFAGSQAFNASG
jgi:hypothetical protein